MSKKYYVEEYSVGKAGEDWAAIDQELELLTDTINKDDELVIVYGNHSFSSYCEDDRQDVVDLLNDCLDEVDRIHQNFYYEDDDPDEEEIAKSVKEEIEEEFTHNMVRTNKLSGSLSNREINTLYNLLYEFNSSRNVIEENEVIAKVLTVMMKEPYVTGTMKGYSQGDWQLYICPKRLVDNNFMNQFEATYFGTGYWYVLYYHPMDEEEFNNLSNKDNDALNKPMENGLELREDWNIRYTWMSYPDDVKQWAAEVISEAIGKSVSPQEIELIQDN